MARWFAEFGLFFSDIWRHTVGRLSGVLSISLPFWGLRCPPFSQGNPDCVILAGRSSLRRSWPLSLPHIQPGKSNTDRPLSSIKRSLRHCKSSMTEGRESLSLSHLAGPPMEIRWTVHPGPPRRGSAQFIQIQPIQSVRGGKLWVTFGQVDFLDQARNVAHPGFVLDIGGEVGNKFINDKSGNLYYVFFKREAPSQQTVDYRIKVTFRWNEKCLEENVILRWHTSEEVLTTLPVGSSTKYLEVLRRNPLKPLLQFFPHIWNGDRVQHQVVERGRRSNCPLPGTPVLGRGLQPLTLKIL